MTEPKLIKAQSFNDVLQDIVAKQEALQKELAAMTPEERAEWDIAEAKRQEETGRRYLRSYAAPVSLSSNCKGEVLMSSNDTVKELGTAAELTMDAFLRTAVAQMFDNDNDTSFLTAKLESSDGGESTLEFKLRIMSINGVPTRDEEEK